MSWNQEPPSLTADMTSERVSAFLARVYAWMFLGLLVTAGTAFVVSSSVPLVEALILNRLDICILLFSLLGPLIDFLRRVSKMSPATAGALFILFSATVGITTSVILFIYTAASIASTFVITAGMFGALA